VIAGMQTDYCINATARRAHALGYDVTLVKDAHSTYPGGGLAASQVIAKYNDALGDVVKLEESSNVTFE
jgi:nicotinamidase-related amidase